MNATIEMILRAVARGECELKINSKNSKLTAKNGKLIYSFEKVEIEMTLPPPK